MPGGDWPGDSGLVAETTKEVPGPLSVATHRRHRRTVPRGCRSPREGLFEQPAKPRRGCVTVSVQVFRLLRCPASLNRSNATLCFALLLGAVIAACGPDSKVPAVPNTPPAQGLEVLSVPSSLLVQESALLTVRMRNADGTQAELPPDVQWKSSDETVIRVQPGDGSAERVVTALRRGTSHSRSPREASRRRSC